MNSLPPWRPVAYQPPDLVLHAPLILELTLIVPRTQYADDLLPKMPRLVAAVPAWWSRHLADLTLSWERAGRVTQQKVERCLLWVYPFQFQIDPETPALAWADVLDLARLHSVSVDDAAYLELAVRLHLPLATTDATLLRAASAAGVPIFTP